MSALHLGELTITSPSFTHSTPIPLEFTTEGEDVSPPLEWTSVPEGTQELAIVCHDPDAPLTRGFDHWALYGIPPTVSGVERDGGSAFVQGLNGWGTIGYRGPAAPPGHDVHHYYFHLYALDSALELEAGLSVSELTARIDEHIIEQARMVGTFSR